MRQHAWSRPTRTRRPPPPPARATHVATKEATPARSAQATRAARRRIVESLTQHDPQIETSTNAPPGDDDDTVCGWQTVYHALLLVEKMASSCPGSLTAVTKIDNAYVALLRGESSSRSALDRDDDDALDGDPLDHPDAPWRAAQQLLTHRHQWVQLAAARVVGRYLAENGGALAAETIARANVRGEQLPAPLAMALSAKPQMQDLTV